MNKSSCKGNDATYIEWGAKKRLPAKVGSKEGQKKTMADLWMECFE